MNSLDNTDDNQANNAPIDFYFDFISPYGWFAAERLKQIIDQLDRTINWQPFLLKVTVVDTMKITPPLDTPLKGDYLYHDIDRSARLYNLPLSNQAIFRFSSLLASRSVVWMRDYAPEKVDELVLKLYRAHWSEARNIADLKTVLDIAASLGIDRETIELGISSDTTKSKFRADNALAVNNGVFGSPTMVVDGEMFWGADRLDMLALWLERGGW